MKLKDIFTKDYMNQYLMVRGFTVEKRELWIDHKNTFEHKDCAILNGDNIGTVKRVFIDLIQRQLLIP